MALPESMHADIADVVSGSMSARAYAFSKGGKEKSFDAVTSYISIDDVDCLPRSR